MLLGINGDEVPLLDEGERSTQKSLGSDVPNHKAVRSTGEAAVRDEGDILAQAKTHDGTGGGEHLAHTRTSLGPLVTDDDDVTLLDLSSKDALESLLLGFKDPGLPLELEAFFSGNLGDRSPWGKIALEDNKVALRFNRVGDLADDLLSLGVGFEGGEVLAKGLARDGHAVAVEESCCKQFLHHRHDAADLDELRHHVLAARLEVGQHGDAFADEGEVLKGKLHPGGVSDGEKVEDRIGRSAEGDHYSDGVLKGLTGHDVERADSFLQEIEHGGAGIIAIFHLMARDSSLG